jgi:hypothetical protein
MRKGIAANNIAGFQRRPNGYFYGVQVGQATLIAKTVSIALLLLQTDA